MERKSARLQFSKEELDNAPVRKAADKAEKAANRADKAKARLPGEQSVVTKGSKKLRHEEDMSAERQAQLRFGKKEVKEETVSGSKKLKGKAESKLNHSASASEKAFGVNGSDRVIHDSGSGFVSEPAMTEKPAVATSTTDFADSEDGLSSAQFTRNRKEARKNAAKEANAAASGKSVAADGKASSAKDSAKKTPISSKLKEETDAAKTVKSHLKFSDENEVIKNPRTSTKGLQRKAGVAASAAVHKKISQSNEDDNASVNAMQAASEAAEGGVRLADDVHYSKKMKEYDKAVRLDQKSHKANLDALYEADKAKNPEKYSNPISKWQQKQKIKKEYEAARAAANARNTAEGAGSAGGAAKKSADSGQRLIERLKQFAVDHSGFIKILLLVLLVLMFISSMLQSCSTMFTGALTTVTATSWPADDIEISKAELDDDAATLLMVDSNLQRETILPSERAFAYKMKNEALKRQAGRPGKDNSAQVGRNFGKETREIIAEEAGVSRNQVSRFIRLTYLIPELLEKVDSKEIAFNPAVELSYLSEEQQRDFLNAMDYAQAAPSLSQAQRIKKLAQNPGDGDDDGDSGGEASGGCTLDNMCTIMNEVKKEEKASNVTFKTNDISKYFPKSYTPKQMQDTIIKLLEQWQKKKNREMDR